MGLNSSSSPKKQKQLPPAGLNLAVCYSIIDLGTQEEQFQGKPATFAQKVHYSFEFPNLPQVVFDNAKGPQPMAIFQEYTVSANEKAKLPKVLSSWGSIPVKDIKAITPAFLKAFLTQACMLSIAHTPAKTAVDSETQRPILYAQIAQNGLAVMPKMADTPKPANIINAVKFLDLDAFDWNVYNSLPQFLQDKIAKCKEWNSITMKFPKPMDNPAGAIAPQGVSPEALAMQNTGGPSF